MIREIIIVAAIPNVSQVPPSNKIVGIVRFGIKFTMNAPYVPK